MTKVTSDFTLYLLHAIVKHIIINTCTTSSVSGGMVNKCAAPGCYRINKTDGDSEKQKVSTFRFPKDDQLRKKWASAVPRESWKPNDNSVLCENHFVESDFQVEREDSNSRRLKSRAKEMSRRKLKRHAVPSQWPDCPILLALIRPALI